MIDVVEVFAGMFSKTLFWSVSVHGDVPETGPSSVFEKDVFCVAAADGLPELCGLFNNYHDGFFEGYRV